MFYDLKELKERVSKIEKAQSLIQSTSTENLVVDAPQTSNVFLQTHDIPLVPLVNNT